MLVVQNKKLDIRAMVKKIPDFEYGVIWENPISGHKIGCLDVSKKEDVEKLMQNKKAILTAEVRRARLCELPHCRTDVLFGFEKCLENSSKIQCRAAKPRGNQPYFFKM